ncbi:MAG: glycosyltransferase family 2 protein [Candidatus Helarchaeota archaeon]
MSKKIIIIIPAFNEEKTIPEVIRKIQTLKNINNKEIIVIDDGSTDKTRLKAKELNAIVISNEKNLGLGKTFRIGLSEALKRNADIIVNIDADGQYDPLYIPIFVKHLLRTKADLIIGNRFLNDKELGKNFIQRIGNKIISVFISKILIRSKEIYDIQTGFRVITRNLAKFLVNNLHAKYTYTQEMMIISSLFNFKIIQLPIKFYKRSSGPSRLIKHPVIYLLKILIITFKTFIRIKTRKILN